MTTRAHGLGRAAIATLVAGLALVTDMAPAAAHAHLESSEPADGAALDVAPDRVVLELSEALDLAPTTAALIDDQGAETDLAVHPGAGRPGSLVLPLPSLSDGVYRVTYRTYGAVDLHEVTGSIVFGVGHAPAAIGGETAAPARRAEVVARATVRLGFAVTTAAVLLLCALPHLAQVGASGRRRAGRALRRAAHAGLLAIAVGTAVGLADDAVAVGGPTVPTLWRLMTRSQPGRRATLTLELSAILAALVVAHHPSARVGRALRVPTALPGHPTSAELGFVVTTVGLAGALAGGGHTGAGLPALADAATEIVHLLAAAAWVGLLVLLPLVVREAELTWHEALRSFAPLAEGLVLVTAATGLVLAAGRVATVTALLTPGYGRILLVKALMVAVAVALGLAVRRTPRSRVTPGRVRPAEVIAAITLVGFGALLASTTPAVGPGFDPLPPAAPSTWSGQADDLAVRVSLSPNRPGTNLVTVDVHNTRRPAPAPITGVSVARAGTGAEEPVTARARDTGSWEVGLVSVAAGEVPLVINVERSGLPDVASSVPWTVPPVPAARHPTILSRAALRPSLDVAALAGVTIGGLVLHRRRHHHLEVPDADRRPTAPTAPAATPVANHRGPHRRARRRGAGDHRPLLERRAP